MSAVARIAVAVVAMLVLFWLQVEAIVWAAGFSSMAGLGAILVSVPVAFWALSVIDRYVGDRDYYIVDGIVCVVLVASLLLSCSSDVRRPADVIVPDAPVITCPGECEAAQACCDTEDGIRCTDVLAELYHCGACGVACREGESCHEGVCR